MTERSNYDPFAPPAAGFPEERLRRVGLPDEIVDNLRARFDAMSGEQAEEFVLSVRRASDPDVLRRFAAPTDPAELEGLKQPELRELAAAEGVPPGGTNEELRTRLAESAQARTGDQPPADQAPAEEARATTTATPEPGEGEQPAAQPVEGDTCQPAEEPAAAPEEPAAAEPTPAEEQPAEGQPEQAPAEESAPTEEQPATEQTATEEPAPAEETPPTEEQAPEPTPTGTTTRARRAR